MRHPRHSALLAVAVIVGVAPASYAQKKTEDKVKKTGSPPAATAPPGGGSGGPPPAPAPAGGGGGAATPDPRVLASITTALAAPGLEACATAWATGQSAITTADAAQSLASAIQTPISDINKDQATLTALSQKNAALSDAETQRCQQDLVVCLDENGKVDDVVPTLVPGDVLNVDVVGFESHVAKSRVHLHFSLKSLNASILAPPTSSSSAPANAAPKNAAEEAPPPDPTKVVACLTDVDQGIQKAIAVQTTQGPKIALATGSGGPVSASDTGVTVTFVRDAAGAGSTDKVTAAATNTIQLEVNPGQYAVDFGVMVPFTVDRQVQAVADLASGQERISSKWNARIVPAFVINAYPGGRARGRVFSAHSSDLWGFQFGTGLNFASHPFGEFYGGVLFTPISGMSVSIGGALVNEQVTQSGQSVGMYLPAGTSYSPSSQYMFWPYLGLSASLDFLDMLRTAWVSATTNTSSTPKK
jgi:hypothetical protein